MYNTIAPLLSRTMLCCIPCIYRTSCAMLVITRRCIHLCIVLRSRASFQCCQSFLVTAHRNTTSSAMLRNMSTIIVQSPWARGSTHTATKNKEAGPAYACAGQTCDARVIKTTCTTYKSRILCKTNEAQAMYTWNSKIKHTPKYAS